jgi:hypothetical protein
MSPFDVLRVEGPMTAAEKMQIQAARFDLHARTILTVILEHGGAVTDALLYFALAKNRVSCDDASTIVNFLFNEQLLKRVGNVAVMVTDKGTIYAKGGA